MRRHRTSCGRGTRLGEFELLGVSGIGGFGIVHLAPDKVVVEPDGRPVLLDSVAARRVIGDKSQTLAAILEPAGAPIEQQAEAASVKPELWTVLHALSATLHDPR